MGDIHLGAEAPFAGILGLLQGVESRCRHAAQRCPPRAASHRGQWRSDASRCAPPPAACKRSARGSGMLAQTAGPVAHARRMQHATRTQRWRLHPPSHAPRPGTTHGSVPAAFLSADLGPGSSGAHHARGAATAGAVAGAATRGSDEIAAGQPQLSTTTMVLALSLLPVTICGHISNKVPRAAGANFSGNSFLLEPAEGSQGTLQLPRAGRRDG